MSDDRFKQARRSLIDRHNQRQQQGGDTFDDDFEDEKTAMVNLDEAGGPTFAPPPNFSSSDDEFDSEGFDDDEATEMITLGELENAVPNRHQQNQSGGLQINTHSGIQPTFNNFGSHREEPPQQGGSGFGQPQSGNFGQQPSGSFGQQSGGFDEPSGNFGQPGGGGFGQKPSGGGFGQQPSHGFGQPETQPGHILEAPQESGSQTLTVGDGGYDGNTAFVNLNDFAQGGEMFTPDVDSGGYEGSTQFVNLAALQAGAAQGSMPIEHDPVLKEAYQFTAESVQQGEITLVFAQNPAGQPVVLKRIWDGDPNGMPLPLRQRVTALDQIRHPRLVGLNGMLGSQTGAWVDLPRPGGYRLTDILSQNGPQPEAAATQWITQVAEILELIHQQGFVYGNLTPDAIWVQDDGSIILEPFDILEFEHRGNLGTFGPPEMNFPPDQRQLYPATDIYSLAAVYVAATTGLPLNLQAVQSMDKKTAAALQSALQQNPQERPQSAREFTSALGGKASGKKPPKKALLAAVAVVAVAAVAGAFLLKPGGGKKNQNKQAAVAAATAGGEQPVAGTNGALAAAGTNGAIVAAGTNGAPAEATAQVASSAGNFEMDPRLEVDAAYRLSESGAPENVVDPDAAAAARAEAREALEEIDKLTDNGKRDKYRQALLAMATAVRASGGPTAEDRKILSELSEEEIVRDIQSEYFDKLHDGMTKGKISRVKSVYPLLASIDADADEMDFFNKNKQLEFKQIPSKNSGDEEE